MLVFKEKVSTFLSDMIFVKMFTLANFGPFMFYPKAHNSLELGTPFPSKTDEFSENHIANFS